MSSAQEGLGMKPPTLYSQPEQTQQATWWPTESNVTSEQQTITPVNNLNISPLNPVKPVLQVCVQQFHTPLQCFPNPSDIAR